MHATDFSNAADLQDFVAIIPGKEQCFNYLVSDLDSPKALATFCMQYTDTDAWLITYGSFYNPTEM